MFIDDKIKEYIEHEKKECKEIWEKIKDEIKSTAKETIKKLKDMNITVHMFTGDTKATAFFILTS